MSTVGLTSTEVSNVWGAYMKNSMEQSFFKYFIETTDDKEIRKVVETMLNQANKNISKVKGIFNEENLTIPLGFTEEDVKVKAPKVFSDTFILYFCHDLTLLSMSALPGALSDCTRKDVRNYF